MRGQLVARKSLSGISGAFCSYTASNRNARCLSCASALDVINLRKLSCLFEYFEDLVFEVVVFSFSNIPAKSSWEIPISQNVARHTCLIHR